MSVNDECIRATQIRPAKPDIFDPCREYCEQFGVYTDLIARGYTTDEHGNRRIFQQVVVWRRQGFFQWLHNFKGMETAVITECIAVYEIAF